MQVDLPALERPTKAISGTSSSGKWNSSAAVVRNRAVCIQPMGVMALISGVSGAEATLAGVFRGLAGAALELETGLVLVAIQVKLSGRQK